MKINCVLFSFFLLVSGILFAQKSIHPEDEKAILNIMNNQEYFWNQGNIERFMEGYWNHPDLVFVGSKGPTYGYQNTLENYIKSYPDKQAMGQLHFDILHTQQWDDTTIQLIGKFTLKREKDQPTGFFTLLFKKLANEWKIVSDHSSSSSPSKRQ